MNWVTFRGNGGGLVAARPCTRTRCVPQLTSAYSRAVVENGVLPLMVGTGMLHTAYSYNMPHRIQRVLLN